MFQGTHAKIILSVILLIVAGYLYIVLAHHSTQQLYEEIYYRNNQSLNLPSEIVSTHDLGTFDKQRPNLLPVGVKVTHKEQPNLPSDGVDLNDKQSPSEEVNLKDKDRPTSEEVQLHDEQQPPKHVDLDDKQQSNLPPKEVTGKDDQQQQESLVTSVVEVNQHLQDLGKSVNFEKPKTLTNVKRYIANLSSSLVKEMVAQMVEVSNLTSRGAQEQFLTCTGLVMLKNSNNLQPGSSIPMPPSHQHCTTMAFKNSGPVVVLASFPGSGNSWVRQLLEASTGIYTGAVYCDSSYIKAGMIGEGVRANNVIVVKAHYDPQIIRTHMKNSKAIYIVRNPFDSMLSEFNREIAVSSKKYASLGDSHTIEVDVNYETKQWTTWVMSQARKWKVNVLKWLTYNQVPVLIVGYENIKKDVHTELKKMLDFVGYPYSESNISCAVKSSGEAFHRNHTKKHGHPYSQELQNYVFNIIKQVDSHLLKHNISYYHQPYNEN